MQILEFFCPTVAEKNIPSHFFPATVSLNQGTYANMLSLKIRNFKEIQLLRTYRRLGQV